MSAARLGAFLIWGMSGGLGASPHLEGETALAAQPQIASVRPVARTVGIPRTRWDYRPNGRLWARAALQSVKTHGAILEQTVPQDIKTWCPTYEDNPSEKRRAFWVGLMSALSKHESTYNPAAVGGRNQWFGLLQIYPPTARSYGCHARTGAALKDATDNLSCAVRIMAVTVPRDNAIAVHDGRWRGIAADWGPMVSAAKRREMAAWTRRQTYCRPLESVRPVARSD